MASIFICITLFVFTDFIDPVSRKASRTKFIGERNYNNGQLMFKTQTKKGQLHGTWESWYVNGQRRDSGMFHNNIPDGEWKVWHNNGHLMYHFHFNSIKFYNISSEIYRQPKYKLYHISGLPKETAVRHLQSPFISQNNIYNVIFRYPKFSPEALEKSIISEPTLYRSPFQYALFHGTYTAYYENGKKKEQGVYINGLKDGMWEEITDDGISQRGTYHYGKKSGEWRTYDQQGKPMEYSQYNHQGKLISHYLFKR